MSCANAGVCVAPVPVRRLEAAARAFARRAARRRKSGKCKCCDRLRKELAPILSTIVAAVLMGEFAVDHARVEEGRLAVEEWMRSQL